MNAPVLLVTGGSRGIGAATALAAAQAGYAVAVNYHSNSLGKVCISQPRSPLAR